MSSTTSGASAPTQTPTMGSDRTTTGAATYYGAIALAIFIMIALSISSVSDSLAFRSRNDRFSRRFPAPQRMLYIRRQRRVNQRERMELMRRGDGTDGPGLPTYRETTSPHTLSYLAHPLSQLRHGHRMDGAPVPTDHPEYTAPTVPGRLYHPGDSTAPPACTSLAPSSSYSVLISNASTDIPQPPKYEEEIMTTESDREAEVGGAGQEVDSTMVGRNSTASRIGQRDGQSGSNSSAAFVIESAEETESASTASPLQETDDDRVERMEREQAAAARTEEENVWSDANPAPLVSRV